MKETQPPRDQQEVDHKDEAIHVWDCGSPLYDSYELVSLSHVIDRHIMVLPSLSGSRQEKSSRFSHHHHVIQSVLFSSSNSSKEAAAAASSKKARVSCGVAVNFLTKFVERNAWNWRICGREREGKAKKVKFSNGIRQVYNGISTLRK